MDSKIEMQKYLVQLAVEIVKQKGGYTLIVDGKPQEYSLDHSPVSIGIVYNELKQVLGISI